MADEEVQETRSPSDSVSIKRLIAKIKKADANLQEQIDEIPIIDVDENLDSTSTNPVENRAVDAALNGKQDQLTEMTDQEVSDLIEALN